VTEGALYVYGVVPRAEREAVSAIGVEGSEVETVESDGLAALTSRVSSDTLGAPRELRAHWRVLQQACESATVLPVRFGTVMQDEKAVRERLLEANADRLQELLKRLRGCVQVTVKGTYREDRLLRAVVAASPALTALAARVRKLPASAAYYDRIRLGEAIAAAVGDRRVADTEQALAALEPAAAAARAEEAPGALDAFNLAFLLKRPSQDDFSRRVSDLVDDVGEQIEVRYVGPLPPYSFAEAELAAGGI
jgi:hypothetical protein